VYFVPSNLGVYLCWFCDKKVVGDYCAFFCCAAKLYSQIRNQRHRRFRKEPLPIVQQVVQKPGLHPDGFTNPHRSPYSPSKVLLNTGSKLVEWLSPWCYVLEWGVQAFRMWMWQPQIRHPHPTLLMETALGKTRSWSKSPTDEAENLTKRMRPMVTTSQCRWRPWPSRATSSLLGNTSAVAMVVVTETGRLGNCYLSWDVCYLEYVMAMLGENTKPKNEH
jgi:hypothetical protein